MKELILREIEDLRAGKISNRVKEYINHNNKYAILKDSVQITVRLKEGIEAVIDITDLVL